MQKPSEKEGKTKKKERVKFMTITTGVVLVLAVVPINQRVRKKKLRWLLGFFTNLEASYTVSGMVSSLLEINGS